MQTPLLHLVESPDLKGLRSTLIRSCMLLVFVFAFSVVQASHFRYGLITATRLSETATTVTYRLNVSLAWRLGSASGAAGFSFTGGNSGFVTVTLSNVTDPSGGWTNSSGSVVVTLNKSATPTRITYSGCCKISTMVNNSDSNWDVYTVLNTNATGSSPVSTLPAIINMPVNALTATYTIPASDPDAGSILTFGTPSFTGNLAGQTEPSGFSINSTTGQITFNTIGKSVGQLYNALVTVTDNDGNQIMLDFIINMVGASNPPVFDYTVTPTNGFVYNVIAGQNISFPIKATDSDPGSTVNLSASGLPVYITTSNFSPAMPATGNPSQTTFSWTPAAAQIGTTNVLNFIATDNVGVQSTTSVTIKVVAEPAPVFISPTPLEGSLRQIITGVLHQDVITAQSSLGSNVSIAFATVPAGASLSPVVPTVGANPGQTTLSWAPTPADFGQKNLSFQATISSTPTIFFTLNYSLIVNTLPSFTSTPAVLTVNDGQPFSYNVIVSDPDIPYGDIVDIIGNVLPSWLTLTPTGNGTALLQGTPTFADGGIHQVELEAEDIYHHGNSSHIFQNFNINVITCTTPVITCPSDITVSTSAGLCESNVYFVATATGTPAPDITYSHEPGSPFPVGTTSVIATATNTCGTVTCSFTVTVTDNENPTIEVAADVAVNNDPGACSATVILAVPTTGDNCGVQAVSNDHPSNTYPVGETTVTWTVTDVHNNINTATQKVTVTDNENPTIAAAADVAVNNDPGACSATVILAVPTTSDNCGVQTVSSDHPSSTYPVGETTVTWTVTDIHNNINTAIQKVTVTDNENSTITAAADVTVNNDLGLCSATVILVAPATGDNCGVQTVSNDHPSNTYPVGESTVTWTVTDLHNNINTATQKVIVTDNENPTIAAAADVAVNNDPGLCSATVTLTAPATGDNCGVLSVSNDHPSNTYPVGETMVIWTVTDLHNNINTATQKVTITDNENPTIAAAADVAVSNDPGLCSATVTLTAPATGDNCGVLSVSNDHPSNTYPVGETMVIWTVTDIHGKTNTAAQKVTVTDNEKPVITVPSNITVDYSPSDCGAIVNYSVSALDNCSGIVTPVLSAGPASGSKFLLGTTTVTYTATDNNNNTSTKSFTVTVNKAPTTSTLSITPGNKQYSDQETFTATIAGGASGCGPQAAGSVTFYVGTQNMGTVAMTPSGANLVGELTKELLEGVAGQMSPGTKIVRAEFIGVNAAYAVSNPANKSLTIVQENALVDYTGDVMKATATATTLNATITLKANIIDISAPQNPADPGYDPYAGDIRNARVMFVNRDNGNTPLHPNWLPVTTLINPLDSKAGTVSVPLSVTLGSTEDYRFITVGIIVNYGGYYIRNNAADNVVVTVYKPSGDFITGGGYIVPTLSVGTKKSDPGKKTNFGFTVKFGKKGINLKGNMNIIFRRTESDNIVHVYQIKANAMQSLGVNASNPNRQTAEYVSKTNLTDITNPLAPLLLSGNKYLYVKMTDNGEPGTKDSISFVLVEGTADPTVLSNIIYSSNWTGYKTEQLKLGGGNLIVHSGFNVGSTASATATRTNATITQQPKSVEADKLFAVKVWPNPAEQYFTLRVEGNNNETVNVKVFDVLGRQVYVTKGSANQNYQFGANFVSGAYTVEVRQGEKRSMIKLIKQ